MARELPDISLIEADCRIAMAEIAERSVSLILCDLPYGTTRNSWDRPLPLEELWRHYERILAPRGVVAMLGQGYFTAELILSKRDWFRYKIAWVKSKATNFLNASHQPLRKHEDISIFYPRRPRYTPQMGKGESYDKGTRKSQATESYGVFRPSRIRSTGTRYPTDVIYFPTAEAEGPVWHPTQKPVELARYLVRTYTAEGDTVLDPCFGSGSFLVAAALEGRNAIGIEHNQGVTRAGREVVDMMEVAQARLENKAMISVTRRMKRARVEDRMGRKETRRTTTERGRREKEKGKIEERTVEQGKNKRAEKGYKDPSNPGDHRRAGRVGEGDGRAGQPADKRRGEKAMRQAGN